MCPLCDAYVEGILKNMSFTLRHKEFINEALGDSLAELRESVERAHCSPTVLRLRAFYCVEVIYHNLLPKILMKIGCAAEYTHAAKSRFQRSYSGLRELYKFVDSIEQNVKATKVEVSFEDRALNKDSTFNIRMKHHFGEFMAISLLCKKSSVVLRRDLNKRNPVNTHLVGGYLATACVNETDTKQCRWGKNLIRISESLPLSPFQEDWT